MTEKWYRYRETHYAAPLDEYDRPCGQGSTKIHLDEYEVLKTTEKGAWIKLGVTWADDATSLEDKFRVVEKRFVRKDGKKRFACPTRAEAMEQFRQRKRRHREILSAQIARVDRALREAEKINVEEI